MNDNNVSYIIKSGLKSGGNYLSTLPGTGDTYMTSSLKFATRFESREAAMKVFASEPASFHCRIVRVKRKLKPPATPCAEHEPKEWVIMCGRGYYINGFQHGDENIETCTRDIAHAKLFNAFEAKLLVKLCPTRREVVHIKDVKEEPEHLKHKPGMLFRTHAGNYVYRLIKPCDRDDREVQYRFNQNVLPWHVDIIFNASPRDVATRKMCPELDVPFKMDDFKRLSQELYKLGTEVSLCNPVDT